MSSNKIQIIDYNENSFAVIGEQTKQCKEDLKGFGGRYNPHLKCGAGWIFSKKSGSKVKSFFEKKKDLVIEFAKISSSDEDEESVSKSCKSNSKGKSSKSTIATAKIVRKNSEDDSEHDSEHDSEVKRESSRAKQVKPAKLAIAKLVPKKTVTCSSSSEEEEEEDRPVNTVSQKEYNEVLRQLDFSKKREIDLQNQIESNKKIIEKYNELREKYKRVKKELKIARNVISTESGDQSSAPEFIQEEVRVTPEEKATGQKAAGQKAKQEDITEEEEPEEEPEEEHPQAEQQEDEHEEEENPEEENPEEAQSRRVCVTM
jgi:hypothetical protein